MEPEGAVMTTCGRCGQLVTIKPHYDGTTVACGCGISLLWAIRDVNEALRLWQAGKETAGPGSSVANPALGCLDCGKPYRSFLLDATLPHDQWRLIHHSDGGVLCANCIVARAARLSGAMAVRMRIEFASDTVSAES